ncbi:unnamed protein product, partial [Symbiodinium sp. KB8]
MSAAVSVAAPVDSAGPTLAKPASPSNATAAASPPLVQAAQPDQSTPHASD